MRNINVREKQNFLNKVSMVSGNYGKFVREFHQPLTGSPRGGLSNCLFACSLRNHNVNKVLIWIYGIWHDENQQTDSLITMLLGERNLGPKLIGDFPGGRMEEFIDVRNIF